MLNSAQSELKFKEKREKDLLDKLRIMDDRLSTSAKAPAALSKKEQHRMEDILTEAKRAKAEALDAYNRVFTTQQKSSDSNSDKARLDAMEKKLDMLLQSLEGMRKDMKKQEKKAPATVPGQAAFSY